MKEKILAQLVQKYAGMSKKFLGLWADKLTAKVTEENQIEGVINELDNLPISVTDLAAEWQKEGDARVIDAKKEWVKNPPKPDKPIKTETPPTDPPTDDTPAWAKALMEQNKALAEKVAGIEAEKQVTSVKQKLDESLKGINRAFWQKRPIPKDEEIETFVNEVKSDYEEFTKDLGGQGFNMPMPRGGGGKPADQKASDKEIKSVVDKLMK